VSTATGQVVARPTFPGTVGAVAAGHDGRTFHAVTPLPALSRVYQRLPFRLGGL
jgi:hypothetical protein